MGIGWKTQSDFDAAQSENGVHHEQPGGTQFSPADVLEKGYPSYDVGDSALDAYWPLQEGSGNTVNDVSGNGHDGTYRNSPTLGASGVFGRNVIDLNGSDQDAKIDGYTSVDTSSAFSYGIWINTDTLGEFESFIYQDGAPKIGKDFEDRATFGGFDGQVIQTAKNVIDADTWYAIVGTWSPSNGARLYVNGVEEAAWSGINDPLNETSNPIVIGSNDLGGNELDGQAGHARIWSRELSAAEATDFYNTPL